MNLTYAEIKADENYMQGYNRAMKIAQKKYDKLFEAAKYFFVMYESSFGEPDETIKDNDFYFELRKLLKLP